MKYNIERLIGLGKVLKREDFVFFWGHTARADKDARACLSQWWLCTFESVESTITVLNNI